MFLRAFKNLIKRSKFRFHDKIENEQKKTDKELKIISEYKKGLMLLTKKNYSDSYKNFSRVKEILDNTHQEKTTNYFWLLKK